MKNTKRAAFIVYVDLQDGWIAEKIAATKKQLEEGLATSIPQLNSEVSYIPAELHPLVTAENQP